MASTLNVDVRPSDTQAFEDGVRAVLYTRVSYRAETGDKPDGAEAPLAVGATVRAELETDGTAQFEIADFAGDASVEVAIEASQGTRLWAAKVKAARGNDRAFHASATFPVDTLVDATVRTEPDSTPAWRRAGRFVRLDDQVADFGGTRLYVAPLATRADDSQWAALRAVLGMGGNGAVDTFEAEAIDAGAVAANAVTTLGLREATLRTDGGFAFEAALSDGPTETGWAWLLVGRESFAGFHPDDPAVASAEHIVIVLPAGALLEGDDAADGGGASSPSGVPMDFDERQLIDNPADFAEDPGSVCHPFSAPQRILGERPFHTILRVDQPEVGGGKVGTDWRAPLLGLSLASMPMRTRALAARDSDRPLETVVRDSVITRMRSPETMTEWSRWIGNRAEGRRAVSRSNPIRWEGDPTEYQATTVCGGHILDWRVQWRSNGYSLGNVAYSLTLAPRQVRRISRVSWSRRDRARRSERTRQQDSVSQTTLSDRDYSDAVQSSLSEWAHGESESKTTSAAGGIGFAMGPVVIGGGAAHGRSSASSTQTGGRRVGASEEQRLRDAIRQWGESARSLNSTVVTEVTQEEEAEGVSEVVRNINYCHSLTVTYSEILRHLRVDTVLSGVRECLFVPFTITPFDLEKAISWREQLRRGLRSRELRSALDHLEEVENDWTGSDIPAGARKDQQIEYLSGSIYVDLSIERPRAQLKDEELADYLKLAWGPFGRILARPARQVHDLLEAMAEQRDSYYQREVAPGMAVKWADRLELFAGDKKIDSIDLTLATRYRFGSKVRIDFQAAAPDGVTRDDLKELKVVAGHDLPPGSSANLRSASIDYSTATFDHSARSAPLVGDLIDVETGAIDPEGAVSYLRLTPWELRDQRVEIESQVDQLITHLNANRVYYHKVIWWLMDRDELYMMLDGFTSPYGRRFDGTDWVDDPGRSIASVVEREPLAILGNSLVLRVASGAFLGVDGHPSPDALREYYVDGAAVPEPLRVSLPTQGLYARALMDECLACEEHAGSLDWVLAQDEPELEALASQLISRRAEPANLTPTEFNDSLINLHAAPAAPAPTGLAGILEAVTSADSFRDMAGLAKTQDNSIEGLKQAASLATGFASKAVDLQTAKYGTQEAKRKLDNIKKAKELGLIDDKEATAQAKKVLESQNVATAGGSLLDNQQVGKVVDKGADGKVKVTRQTAEGAETVEVDASKKDDSGSDSSSSKSPATRTPAPGTNPGSTVADAQAMITTIRGLDPSTVKFTFAPDDVADSLARLFSDKKHPSQGKLNLCGPAATLRAVMNRDRKLVAGFVAGLYAHGDARWGTRTVEPGGDLRRQLMDPAWGVEPAAWIAMSSLRDDENWLLDFEGTPDEDVAAATTPGEVADWLEETNLYSNVRNEANLVVNRDVDHILGLTPDNRHDVILLIHAHLLRGQPVAASGGAPIDGEVKSDEFILNSFPNHFIMLDGPATLNGDRVEFNAWSWGTNYDVSVPVDTFRKNYYGAVIATA
ncbi:hypothetical protein QQX13_09335 [Demequina sp. SYSU T00068]|uniref:hypothetical protein n=1 Tax=Demequina lignilytica TaxID=3051663 RepID=UPI00260D4340|nr:hypothetical protein [Demequina sp. SYSU T00068]MDN4491031.1 hypothetical protein [Demequina sp. SYSU T00068]